MENRKKNTVQNHAAKPEKSLENRPSPEDNAPSQLDARTKIVNILTRVETQHAYTDKLLDKEITEFGAEDRGLITEVVNGVLRWQYRLDWYLSQLYVGAYNNLIPDVKNNLRSSAYQLMYLDRVPAYAVLNEAVEIAKNKFNQKTANLVNAILRNLLRQQKKLEYLEMKLEYLERLSVSYSHPLWLVRRWIEQWGIDDTVALCQSNNRRPRISIRINHLKIEPTAFFSILDENQVEYEQHPDFSEYVWIDNFSEFRKLDLMKKGAAIVQDISTGLPVRLLAPRPGETVLDMCAAPGGKTAFIGEMMNDNGRLMALEKHHSRAKMLSDNLQRQGISIAGVITADATKIPSRLRFDKILLDAPCSGLGVLNKRVDLRWKRTLNDIDAMTKLQLKLLKSAASVLNENGSIVYSTCTIETAENENVIRQFLSENSQFKLYKIGQEIPLQFCWDKNTIRTFPHRHQMDGSFAVRLRKQPH